MLEGDFSKSLKKNLPGFFHKIGASQLTPGIPDFIGCWKGYYFAIEVKNATRQVTELQQESLRKTTLMGRGYSFLVRFDECDIFWYLLMGAERYELLAQFPISMLSKEQVSQVFSWALSTRANPPS